MGNQTDNELKVRKRKETIAKVGPANQCRKGKVVKLITGLHLSRNLASTFYIPVLYLSVPTSHPYLGSSTITQITNKISVLEPLR